MREFSIGIMLSHIMLAAEELWMELQTETEEHFRRADVLFFDEATSALDSRTEGEINRSIAAIAARNPGLTLLVIAHRETSLEYCDRIITLEK